MKNTQNFDLGSNFTEQEFVDGLAGLFKMVGDPPVTETITFYDTFDWRLYKKSLLLYQAGNNFVLCELPDNNIVQRVTVQEHPVYFRDFPEGPLRVHLENLLELRALLKIVEVETSSTTYNILNDSEKTMARLTIESLQYEAVENGLEAQIELAPVRGYSKVAQKLRHHFKEIGLNYTEDNLFLNAVSSTGRQPGAYSAKPVFHLEPQMRSDEAAKVILRFLTGVMRQNEDGVKQDIDVEFLHDFRVAVRRIRSALSQIKGVFPKETTRCFRRDLNYIGKLTNELRDLDVYLMEEDHYKAMLPDVLRDDIEPLFDYLKQNRKVALKDAVSGLNSKKYVEIMYAWEKFLSERLEDSPNAKNAARPAVDLACHRILKRYKSIVKKGTRLVEQYDEKKMHPLRVQCKELRYLLEFFASLFPWQQINHLTKQLKTIQTCLGDFNDLRVQEEYLLNISKELPLNKVETHQTLLAIGSLVNTLHTSRERVTEDFFKAFDEFASPENNRLFEELSASTEKRG